MIIESSQTKACNTADCVGSTIVSKIFSRNFRNNCTLCPNYRTFSKICCQPLAKKLSDKFELPYIKGTAITDSPFFLFYIFFYFAGMPFVHSIVIDSNHQNFSSIVLNHLWIVPVFNLINRSCFCFIPF